MSWSQFAQGTAPTAAAQVNKLTTPQHLSGAELELYTIGKQALADALGRFDKSVIVNVNYSGHIYNGAGNLTIEIKPLYDLRNEPQEGS